MIWLLFSFLSLREEGVKRGVEAKRAWEKVFSLHPEYRKFIRNPSRNLLEKITRTKGPDTIKVLVIRVEFQEDTSSLTTGNGRFKLEPTGCPCETVVVANEDSTAYDTIIQRNLYYDPPHDSIYFHRLLEALRNYYLDVSHGKLYIKWKMVPETPDTGYVLPHTMLYYGDPDNWIFGLFSLLKDAIAAADRDPIDIDFSDYDAYIIFHAGAMWQSNPWVGEYDIPAVYVGDAHLFFGEPILANNGTDTITDGIIYAETGFKEDGTVAFMQGGLCHEFGHQLGFLDLYDTSMETMGCGGWALMGTGNWNMLGLVPPRVSVWHRVKVGFDTPVVIDHDTTGLVIHWAGSDSEPRVYKIPINSHEYFLIENRYTYMNPDTIRYADPCTARIDSNGFRVWKDNVLVDVNDWDVSLPPDINSGGLAIWHIDENKIKEYDTLNMINAGFPHGVDMEEADGIQDFEKDFWWVEDIYATFYGTPYDVFFRGGYLSEFTENTDPSTEDNTHAFTFISIENISSPGKSMTFDVKFKRSVPGFPKELGLPMDVISPVKLKDGRILQGTFPGIYFADGESLFSLEDSTYSLPAVSDVNGDGEEEIITADLGGNVYVFSPNGVCLARYKLGGSVIGSPAVYDVDVDGKKEIAIASNDEHVYLFEFQDSLVLEDGYPVWLGQMVWSTPLLYEHAVYVLSGDGTLWRFDENGRKVWRKGKESLAFTTSSPVMGDINGDGLKEILCITGYGLVYCVSEPGSILWERSIPDTNFFSSPALGDVNGDGYPELVLAAKNKIYAVDHNGCVLDNFPVEIDSQEYIQSSIVLSDVDDDGRVDILFTSPDGGVYAFNGNGDRIYGFPLGTGGKTYSTPLVCDYDGDPSTSEIFVGSEDGYLYGWRVFSSLKEGWNMAYGTPEHWMVYNIPVTPTTTFQSLEEFYIYPNPGRGNRVNLRYTLEEGVRSVRYIVFSMAGDILIEGEGTTNAGVNDVPIDVSSLANGVYILYIEIQDGEKTIKDKKVFGIARWEVR